MGIKKPLKLNAGFCAAVGAPLLLYSAAGIMAALSTPVAPVPAAAPAAAPAEPVEAVKKPPADQPLSVEERNRFAPAGALGDAEYAYIASVEKFYRNGSAVREWPYVAGNNNVLPAFVRGTDIEGAAGSAASSASAQRQHIPFWQFWRRWESADRPSAVCAFSSAEYDTELVRVIALIDELREDGLAEDEWRFQNDCMGSLPMPQAMLDLDNSKVQELFANEKWRARLAEKFSNWIPREEWTSYGKAEEAYQQRVEAFAFLNESLHQAYGYKAPKLVLVPLEDHHLLRGEHHQRFQGGGSAIVLNTNAVFTIMDDPEQAIKTLAEEIKHSIDSQMASEFFEGKLQKDDPRFQHASIIFLNNRAMGYAAPLSFFQNGQLVGDAQSYQEYMQQYLERTAKDYANGFVGLTQRAMQGEAMPWEEEQPVQVAGQAAAPKASM